MSEPILRVENIEAKYGDFIAVHDASFEIPQGMIVSVIGANGAGKSTLMDCIAGVHKPSSGRVLFKGEDIAGLPAYEIVNRGLSLVPQGSRCFIRMSVEDNLYMGSFPKRARARAERYLGAGVRAVSGAERKAQGACRVPVRRAAPDGGRRQGADDESGASAV
jgi:branched-chain amino acid transport system ATP-binding protein